jgi:NADH-ubiquinone oxidoreductase chain 2
LLISSLLSLIIGTVVGLSQIKVKRLLAFSSISHVGFLLLALSIYTQKSIDSFIFYLVQYSITNLNIFLILLAFAYLRCSRLYYIAIALRSNAAAPDLRNKHSGTIVSATAGSNVMHTRGASGVATDLNYLIELKGELYKNPILSISLAVCLFSMAGIPPLIGFFSKQFVLFSSIENGNYFLSVIAILISVISASYYLKLIKLTFFESAQEPEMNGINSVMLAPAAATLAKGREHTFSAQEQVQPLRTTHSGHLLSQLHSYTISILSCIILFFFLYPTIILNGTQLISLTIFNL